MNREEVSFDSIPDKAFTPAVKLREIVKARPLSREEKASIQRGSADIKIVPLIGNPYLMKREEMLSNFCYTNGKAIKTSGWKSDRNYVIFRKDNTQVMVIQIPSNTIIRTKKFTVNSKVRKNGDYIVCLKNPDGSINRQSASCVNAAIFRKMCYIPMNAHINKFRGRHSSNFSLSKIIENVSSKVKSMGNVNFGVNWDNNYSDQNNSNLFENNQNYNQKSNNFDKYTGNDSFNLDGLKVNGTTDYDFYDFMSSVSNNEPEKIVNESKPDNIKNIPVVNSKNTQATVTDTRYELIAQIHDMYGKRVGYTIKAYTGQTKNITKNQALSLAAKKRLKNAELVTENGKEPYIRGNGFKLDSLPITYE